MSLLVMLLVALGILGLTWMAASRLGWERQVAALKALAFSIRRDLPLGEALSALSRETGGKVGRRCRKAFEMAGAGLSAPEALAGLFRLLPKDLSSGIQAGAGAEAIAASLEDAAARLELRAERRADLAMQFLYPAVLGLACVFQVTFILPKLMEMFDEVGASLPRSVSWIPVLAGVPFLLILLGLRWAAAGRDPWALLSGCLASAIRSGAQLPARMGELAVRGPRRIRARARALAEGLRDGRALPDLLEEAGAPAVLRWLSKVGARTGEPAQALAQASDLLDASRERRRGQALAAFPPLIVVSEAVLVGFCAWAVFGSMISMIEAGVLW